MKTTSLAAATFHRDILTLWRQPGDLLQALGVFILISLLPVFFVSNQLALVEQAPASIWTALILAHLLCLSSMWGNDDISGCLAQMLLNPRGVWPIIAGKSLAYAVIQGLPLLIMAPLSAMMLHMPLDAIAILMIGLLAGLPVLVLLGSFTSLLLLLTKRQTALLALMMLPLLLPQMLLGVGATLASIHHEPFSKPLGLLASLTCGVMALMPWLIAQGLALYRPLGLLKTRHFQQRNN